MVSSFHSDSTHPPSFQLPMSTPSKLPHLLTLRSLTHRGTQKHGGRILLSSHVEQINIAEMGRATGVTLRGGGTITARKAVVSGASIWDTLRLLPPGAAPTEYAQTSEDIPLCPSFMHLHIGFDATGGSGWQAFGSIWIPASPTSSGLDQAVQHGQTKMMLIGTY